VVTVAPEENAADAARLLARRKLGCLPVLSRGRLQGMLSVRDYFYYLLGERAIAAGGAER
jgi:CBS domain-containing protein